MKLKDARELYYFYSGKTSDLVRQLGLAGIAVVWLFRNNGTGVPKIDEPLVAPLVLIVIALASDLLQYAIATSIWGIFQRRKELSGVSEDSDFKAPRQFNWPGISLFVLKVAATVVAYCLLLRYLATVVI